MCLYRVSIVVRVNMGMILRTAIPTTYQDHSINDNFLKFHCYTFN